MVRGIDIFREFFRDFKEQYTLIGGVACDLIFAENDLNFRATKDFDVVLIVEALTADFGRQFWRFISDGGYIARLKSTGFPQFFRFEKPQKGDYPYMIELFARTDVLSDSGKICVPLHIDDEISSLSAILLNADYYDMLVKGRIVIADIPVLPTLCLIPFKARAWLDLTSRRKSGQAVDERDIRKHRNDAIRLSTLLTGIEKYQLSASVKTDMETFISNLGNESVDMKSLQLYGVTLKDVIETLNQVYMS